MRDLSVESKNQVCIIGKLLDASFTEVTSKKDGRKFERADLTVRVTQSYDGQEETSDIPVRMFAGPYTSTGKINPAYENIQNLKKLETVQTAGEAEAATVSMRRATLHENNFVSRNGNLVNTWQINNSFINTNKTLGYIASFTVDAFIMDMVDEMDRNGEPTGRMIIKGGVVQYGGALDVFNFIVEEPNKVEYLRRNWNPNDTVEIGGRIRVTVKEDTSTRTSSWGEVLPVATTQVVSELIVTTGDDEAKDEDFSYDPAEIRKAFNVRKAKIEQMQIDATKKPAPKPAERPVGKYDWE